jgi:predicted component of type VI protein secretion system
MEKLHMRRTFIFSIIFAAAMITGCSNQDEVKIDEPEDVDVSTDPFLNFSVKNITSGTRDEEIIKGVKSIAETYKDRVINIRVNAEEQRNTIIDKTIKDIEINAVELENQRDLYAQKCLNIQNEGQGRICKKIDEETEQAIANIQIAKDNQKTTIDNINIDEIKDLSVIKKEFITIFSDFETENKIDLPNPF